MTSHLATDLAIRNWKPKGDGEARSTGNRIGLYVRGWTSGAKAFYLRTSSWLKMGDYPALGLAQARELCLVAKRLRKEGFSDAALRRGFANCRNHAQFEDVVRGEALAGLGSRGEISVPTYEFMWREWFADVEPALQEGPSRRRPRAIHQHHIAPQIGSRPINEIRRREVHDLLLPLFRKSPVTAGHALGQMKKVFELAITKEYSESNPVPPRSSFPKRASRKKHHGTLPALHMPRLWAYVEATAANHSTKAAILTALVTGHRIGVVVRAVWEHIDWTPEPGQCLNARTRQRSAG